MNVFTQPKRIALTRKYLGLGAACLVVLFVASIGLGHFTGRHTASSIGSGSSATAVVAPQKAVDPFAVYVANHPREFTRLGCMRTLIATRGYSVAPFNIRPDAASAFLSRYASTCSEVMTSKDKLAARWISLNSHWDEKIIGWFGQLR